MDQFYQPKGMDINNQLQRIPYPVKSRHLKRCQILMIFQFESLDVVRNKYPYNYEMLEEDLEQIRSQYAKSSASSEYLPSLPSASENSVQISSVVENPSKESSSQETVGPRYDSTFPPSMCARPQVRDPRAYILGLLEDNNSVIHDRQPGEFTDPLLDEDDSYYGPEVEE